MDHLTEEQVIDRIRELCPCRDAAEAERIVGATLGVLAEQLFEEEREFLARELPPGIAQLIWSERRAPAHDSREFLHRVSQRERVRVGLGVEHAEVVCRVLAECLSRSTLERLRHEAPQIAELFVDLDEASSEGSSPSGSLEPSEALPRAHRNSVAASDDPHADTRLSSARGLTQEREGRTLAAGQPGSRRPLSSGRG